MFLARSAASLAGDGPPRPKGRILVVVQLDGGNDGLNTVIPYGDDDYRKRRPTLQISAKEVQQGRRPRRAAPRARRFRQAAGAAAAGDRPERRLPEPEPLALREHGDLAHRRLNPDTAAPGWLARAIDRRPGRRETRLACTSTTRSRCPGRGRRPAGDPVAGPAGAVPPTVWACPKAPTRPHRPRPSTGWRGRPRRARLAPPVRRAVQPDHLRQQRPA